MYPSNQPQIPQVPFPQQQPPVKKQPSITIKLLIIAGLMIMLIVPWALLEFLIYDRQNQSEQAVFEVSNGWSNEQTVQGPMLLIPYKVWSTDANNKPVWSISHLHVLPEKLIINGKIDPERRYRGIYEVVVYSSTLNLDGSFRIPDPSLFKIRPEDVMWSDAFISVGISDMRGIRDAVQLNWMDSTVAFNPGGADGVSGMTAPALMSNDSLIGSDISFRFKLGLNGSRSLNIEPVGKTTEVQLESPWTTPSFQGQFLPDEREINANGFLAKWKVLHLNRSYPQLWADQQYSASGSQFGVTLMVPVDHYTKSARASKYAILVIGLSFLVYFFVEVMQKLRIHPFQYILVGLAICIFYLLLLSFSEHMKFNLAYILAALATIAAIVGYSAAIFRKKKPTIIMLLVQILLYGFMFVIIQLEDYALLVGSVAMFIILIILMYLSRKINWYGDEESVSDSGNIST